MDTDNLITHYLDELRQVLRGLPTGPLAEAVALLRQARLQGRTVFVFGNGGSAATASHMVCDLGKNTRRAGLPPVRIVGLNDNMPGFSAYANDEGYDSVFAEPLRALARPGDIVIAISGSGRSPNVIRAVQAARELGLTTVGLTGFAGGRLKDLVDVCIIVPSEDMQYIEDAHLVINHILTRALYEQDTG
ncbi:MAG: SIS domain-containing protein [Anaerolineae bacterium]